ncbi:MAG: cyclic nucleotide-binding domain-containing protein [Anaerolineaceae bacterium]|nr:cyclic nucleotide-binding domain-containing protein [Anaerolineaceae bacterium]
MTTTNDLVQMNALRDISDQQLMELRAILQKSQYAAGEVIIQQNQRATDLYILISGEVEITHRPYDGPAITVAKVKAGGVFGWSAILGREKYSSTVTALEDCVVYHVRGFKLQHFCEEHHETGVVLLEKMALSVAQQPAQIHNQIMKILQSAMDYRDDDSHEVS